MCKVASTTGASTASGPVRHTSRYTHFVAKDSDSDSEIEEPQRADTQDKAGSKAMTTSLKLTKVPDFNGMRFCRVCNQFEILFRNGDLIRPSPGRGGRCGRGRGMGGQDGLRAGADAR